MLIYGPHNPFAKPQKPTDHPDPATGGFTQLLPSNASKTRLHLPFTMAEYNSSSLVGIAGFGIHAGGHPEGLDHEWIDLPGDVPVRSWADGKVTKVGVLGTTGNEPTTYEVVINYGSGLIGQHNEVQKVVVKKGQKVKVGDVVGYSHNTDGTTNAEFELSDLNRANNAAGDGTTVSPYDYLVESDKLALVAAYRDKLALAANKPQSQPGQAQFYVFAQPYLTNDLFSHYDANGALSGVWYSTKQWGNGGPYDILAIQQSTNPYFSGNYVYATDFAGNFRNTLDTTFTVNGQNLLFAGGQFNKQQYATYEIGTRKDGRRTLTIKFSDLGYPPLAGDAVTYLERSNMGVQEEGHKLGVYK